MAKDEMPYDPEIAQAAADNLYAAVSMKNPTMWPKGSDRATLGDKTRAKSEIWSTYPEIADKSQTMQDAAAQMVGVAGTGPDAVRSNMKQLGDGCKDCHEQFRVPKDE
jgi:cytochrome c556